MCIVSSPAMSTHGGAVRGIIKHLMLFGVKGSWILGTRILTAKVKSRLSPRNWSGPFYSIEQVSNSFGIPYHYVAKVTGRKFHELLDRYKPDLLISISCPQIIDREIRDRIPMGCVNVHGSPLPKYRGLMPSFWVLRNGEKTTAATVHDLRAKLDDGEILVQREVKILPEDTWDSLVDKTKAEGVKALIEAVRKIEQGTAVRRPNKEKDATYFSFPSSEDRKEFIKAGRKFF